MILLVGIILTDCSLCVGDSECLQCSHGSCVLERSGELQTGKIPRPWQ